MMHRKLPLILVALLAGAVAAAQDRAEPTRERKTVERETATETKAPEAADTEAETEATEGEAKTGFSAVFERMRRASQLPRAAEDAREAGVEEEQVRDVIRVARERRIPADQTQEILEVETEEVRQGSDPRNFGAVVQDLKASGLRGRELAEAIHEEQIARGMKKPKHGEGGDDGSSDDDSSGDEKEDRDKDNDKGKGRNKDKSDKKARGN